MKKIIFIFLLFTIGIFAQNVGKHTWDQVDGFYDNLNGSTPTLTGTLTVNGTIIGYKDNATSFRNKGLSLYGNAVQTYQGIFKSAGYIDGIEGNIGLLPQRLIIGSNDSLDISIQSSNALILWAQDGTHPTSFVHIGAGDSIVFSPRTQAEANSKNQLIIDRTDTTKSGATNTSSIELKTTNQKLSFVGNFIPQGLGYALDTSTTANAVKIALDANITLRPGLELTIIAANANSGAMTLVVNSLSSKAITKAASGAINTAMASGDVLADQVIKVVYDGTQYQIISRLAQ